jgi:hypothetical protein
MSLTDLKVITNEIIKRRRTHVSMVELGSGVSTLFFSKVLEKLGAGNRLDSFEADMSWFVYVRDLLKRNKVSDRYRVHLIRYVSGGSYTWFDQSMITKTIPRHGIDFLVVDAPPDTFGSRVREPAVPFLLPFLKRNSVVFLHDAKRDGEIAVSEKWQEYFESYELLDTEKGMAIFRSPKGKALI